jgi:hypothetical protein
MPAIAERTVFATALTMVDDPLDRMLWRAHVDLVPMGPAGGEIEASGKVLEIFLDALLAFSTDSHSYLLHGDFASSLSKEETELRQKVLALGSTISDQDRTLPAWTVIERMLENLGLEAR